MSLSLIPLYMEKKVGALSIGKSGTMYQMFTPLLQDQEVRQRMVEMTVVVNMALLNPSLPANEATANLRVFKLLLCLSEMLYAGQF